MRWRVTISGSFNGFFTSTPGEYYWQAQHVAPVCRVKACLVVSEIKSFRVTG